MELKKLTLAALVATLGIGLVGCGSDGDTTTITVEGDTNTTGGDNTDGGGNVPSGPSELCPSWTTAKNRDAEGNDVCALPSVITEDRTLTNDIVWLMEGRVTVGNGNQEMSTTQGLLENGDDVMEVTLTIQQGTEIKGAVGTFANLLITRGSKIDARGTAEAPIIFSSDDDDYEGTGEWGGLIIHGYGMHNECSGTPTCNIDSEGESGFAGGFDNDDDSGRLSYVVLTEGGFEFAEGNEINGISFMSVGRGTQVDHIQVHANADDGIEMYGGAVNMKYVVLTDNLDDSVDWDEGYQGNLQYLIAEQINTDANEGNAIEADTEGTTDFYSMPFIMNATFLGSSFIDNLHRMKVSTGGFIFNSVLGGVDDATFENCVLVEDAGTEANVNTRLVYENIIADCNTFALNGGGAPVAFGGAIDMVAADLNDLYASQAPEAVLGGVVDLTPYESDGDVMTNLTAELDFLDETDYIGAVDPAATEAWWEGWTLEGTLDKTR